MSQRRLEWHVSPEFEPPARALGAQVWLERHATSGQVARLMARAAECGLRHVRLFLMWPWIEAVQGRWDFALFDSAFDKANENALLVKATLTANSGPWWLGTGGVLHSHTTVLDDRQYPAIESYVEACVNRYRNHPALGQWILWNEPHNMPHDSYSEHEPSLALWPTLLKERYGSIEELNHRWLTGYTSFADVPPANETYNRAHKGMPWRGFDPLLDDCRLRAAALVQDLELIAQTVRRLDPRTPLCANPNLTLLNHAEAGYDLPALGSVVDVLGATFHAPWTFAFAPRSQHLPLTLAGLSLLSNIPGVARAEVTEFQLGNAYLAANRPMGVTPAQIAAGYLFPILAGAESVTGWDLNTRQHGYEAGEWSLLDSVDDLTPRSKAAHQVSTVLSRLDEMLGPWTPQPAQAWVVVSAAAQAVQYAHGELQQQDDPGRGRHEAIQGSAVLAAQLRTMGVASALVPEEALFGDEPPSVIVVSHMVAWSEQFADRLLDLASAGATILFDGTSGVYTPAGTLHKPWPGGMSLTGLRARGLTSRPDGPLDWSLLLYGAPAGAYPLVHADAQFDDDAGWSVVQGLRVVESDNAAAAWTRTYGSGRLIYATGPLAPTALRAEAAPALEYLLSYACQRLARPCRPAGSRTTCVRVDGARGTAIGVWTAADATQAPVARLSLPPGHYHDIWNDTEFSHTGLGELRLESQDGICLLVSRG